MNLFTQGVRIYYCRLKIDRQLFCGFFHLLWVVIFLGSESLVQEHLWTEFDPAQRFIEVILGNSQTHTHCRPRLSKVSEKMSSDGPWSWSGLVNAADSDTCQVFLCSIQQTFRNKLQSHIFCANLFNCERIIYTVAVSLASCWFCNVIDHFGRRKQHRSRSTFCSIFVTCPQKEEVTTIARQQYT